MKILLQNNMLGAVYPEDEPGTMHFSEVLRDVIPNDKPFYGIDLEWGKNISTDEIFEESYTATQSRCQDIPENTLAHDINHFIDSEYVIHSCSLFGPASTLDQAQKERRLQKQQELLNNQSCQCFYLPTHTSKKAVLQAVENILLAYPGRGDRQIFVDIVVTMSRLARCNPFLASQLRAITVTTCQDRLLELFDVWDDERFQQFNQLWESKFENPDGSLQYPQYNFVGMLNEVKLYIRSMSKVMARRCQRAFSILLSHNPYESPEYEQAVSSEDMHPWSDSSQNILGRTHKGGEPIGACAGVDHPYPPLDSYISFPDGTIACLKEGPENKYTNRKIKAMYQQVIPASGQSVDPATYLQSECNVSAVTHDVRFPTGLLFGVESQDSLIKHSKSKRSVVWNINPAGAYPTHPGENFSFYPESCPRFLIYPEDNIFNYGYMAHAAKNHYDVYGGKEAFEEDRANIKDICQPFFTHLEMIMSDEDDRKVFLNYAAHAIQCPGIKETFAVILAGEQGSGKDTLLDLCFSHIHPKFCVQVTDTTLMAPFNDYIASAVLNLTECGDNSSGFKRETSAIYNKLKSIIAGNSMSTVNKKYQNAYSVLNTCAIVGTTNNIDGSFYLGDNDRRFYIIKTVFPKNLMETKGQYFSDLFNLWANKTFEYKGMRKRGAEWLREYLLWYYDVSAFNPTQCPTNSFKEFMLKLSNNLSPEEMDGYAEANGLNTQVVKEAAAKVIKLEQEHLAQKDRSKEQVTQDTAALCLATLFRDYCKKYPHQTPIYFSALHASLQKIPGTAASICPKWISTNSKRFAQSLNYKQVYTKTNDTIQLATSSCIRNSHVFFHESFIKFVDEAYRSNVLSRSSDNRCYWFSEISLGIKKLIQGESPWKRWGTDMRDMLQSTVISKLKQLQTNIVAKIEQRLEVEVDEKLLDFNQLFESDQLPLSRPPFVE